MTLRPTVAAAALILLCSALFFNCRSQSSVPIPVPDSLAARELGRNLIREYNPSRTYVLFKDGHDSLSSERSIRYIIYRARDSHRELDGKFAHGYIKWLDDRRIEVKSVPENATQNKSLTPFVREVFVY